MFNRFGIVLGLLTTASSQAIVSPHKPALSCKHSFTGLWDGKLDPDNVDIQLTNWIADDPNTYNGYGIFSKPGVNGPKHYGFDYTGPGKCVENPDGTVTGVLEDIDSTITMRVESHTTSHIDVTCRGGEPSMAGYHAGTVYKRPFWNDIINEYRDIYRDLSLREETRLYETYLLAIARDLSLTDVRIALDSELQLIRSHRDEESIVQTNALTDVQYYNRSQNRPR